MRYLVVVVAFVLSANLSYASAMQDDGKTGWALISLPLLAVTVIGGGALLYWTYVRISRRVARDGPPPWPKPSR